MTDRFTTKGFADYFIEQRGHTNTFLDRLMFLSTEEDREGSWKALPEDCQCRWKTRLSGTSHVQTITAPEMVRLSDPGLEEAVNDRISLSASADSPSQVRFPITLPSAGSECPSGTQSLRRLFEEINRAA